MKVCGIHPLGHDSCYVSIDTENKEINAATLERYSRKKHDARYIGNLLDFDLEIPETEVGYISNTSNSERDIELMDLFQNVYELERSLQKRFNMKKSIKRLYYKFLYSSISKKGPGLNGKSQLQKTISTDFKIKTIHSIDHHLCHAASAFFTRPRDFSSQMIIFTLDGQGDGSSGKVFRANDDRIVEISSNKATHSICFLFSIFTEVAGYAPNADEGKLEALANFYTGGRPELLEILDRAIKVESGNITMSPTIDWPFNDVMKQRRKIKKRLKEELQKTSKEEFSYVIQTIFEKKVSEWIDHWTKSESQQICLAGGGFANVKLNRILFEKCGHQLSIFPAMGDDGAAFGAAILAANALKQDITWLRDLREPYFGKNTENNLELLKNLIVDRRLNYLELTETEKQNYVIKAITDGKIGAIYQGKSEFGPRALGHRSIIATSKDERVRQELNDRFKRREWYQPFCPMVLDEDADRIFVKSYPNQHMTCAFTVNEEHRNKIPAVVHVDNTARAQIITQENPFWYNVLKGVKKIDGYGVCLNTSFNLHGRAIVNSYEHALQDFMDCGIDYLILDNTLVLKR